MITVVNEEQTPFLSALRRLLRGTFVTRAYLFGSRARGDHSATSDIDVLVEYDPSKKCSLLDMCGLELAIQEQLGQPVHLLTPAELGPRVREEVENEKVLIYEQAS